MLVRDQQALTGAVELSAVPVAAGVTAEAPFGGAKQSGMGRESGYEGVLEYTESKTRYFGGM